MIFLLYPLVAKAFEKPKEFIATSSEAVLAPGQFGVSNETLVRAYFADAPIMVEVARAESRFYEKAKNPHSTAKGIFQILDGTWRAYGCTGNVLNAVDNIICARKIYDLDGTSPWLASAHVWDG